MKHQPTLICTLHATDLSFTFFTHAHMRIFQLLLKGKEVPEITTILNLADGTVQNEIEAMAHRLQCSGKFAFLIKCLNCGFIEMRFASPPPKAFFENKKVNCALENSSLTCTLNIGITDVKFIYTLHQPNINNE